MSEIPRSKCCGAKAWIGLQAPASYECDKCRLECEVIAPNTSEAELDEILARLGLPEGFPSEDARLVLELPEFLEAKQKLLSWRDREVAEAFNKIESRLDDGKRSHSMAVIREAIHSVAHPYKATRRTLTPTNKEQSKE